MPLPSLSREAIPRLQLFAVLLAASVLGWGSAYAVDESLAGLIAPPEDLDEPALVAIAGADAPRSPRPPRHSRTDFVKPIVERSIFDSSKVGAEEQQVRGEELSELDLVLLATVVARPEEFSSALIAEPGKRTTRKRRGRRRTVTTDYENSRGYGLGDEVPGGATVVSIEQGKVTLEHGGQKAVLVIGDPRDEAKASTSSSRGSSEDDDGVEKVDRNRYAIDREVIDELSEDPSKLAKLGRVRPHKKDGAVDGYRLSGMRRNSLGRKLGLRNGDVVHSVNGHELTSMSAAMNAYNALQADRELEVQITRRNRSRVLNYEIR